MEKEFSTISSELVMNALNYYSKYFSLIDVPTYIKKEYIKHTAPNKKVLSHGELAYVGSAEQSFIQMHQEGKLTKGFLMAITPCHRDEEVLDETHLEVFLKIELIFVGGHIKNKLLSGVMVFFKSMNPEGITDMVDSGNRLGEVDILMNGIEIGSYGEAYMPDGTPYTYGTGLAEPRFSYAKSLNKD